MASDKIKIEWRLFVAAKKGLELSMEKQELLQKIGARRCIFWDTLALPLDKKEEAANILEDGFTLEKMIFVAWGDPKEHRNTLLYDDLVQLSFRLKDKIYWLRRNSPQRKAAIACLQNRIDGLERLIETL